MANGDGERAGCRLSQTAALVEIGIGGQRGFMLARGVHPAGEPLDCEVAFRRAEPPWARSRRRPRLPAVGSPRQPRPPRPGRAGARAASCGAGARRMRPPLGRRADPPGAGWTRPVTESANSTGHPASEQARISAVNSSHVRRSSRAEAVTSVAPAKSSGPSRVMSDTRVSTRDLRSVGSGARHVDGGQRQQVQRPGRAGPSAAARTGAARATVPSHRCRRRDRGSTRSRPEHGDGAGRRARRARAAASAASRRSSQLELTGIALDGQRAAL